MKGLGIGTHNVPTGRTRSSFAILLVILTIIGGLLYTATNATAADTVSLVVKLVDGLTPADQAAVIARNGGVETSSVPALRLHVVTVPTADQPLVQQNYQADAQVVSVEVNKSRKAEAIPTDANYGVQWALSKIGWESVFGTVTPTGTATLALLDTGIDATHPDLAGKVISGTSILDGSNGLSDPSGHGTWLAGIVAAATDNGTGIAGVAFGSVQIMPVSVLNTAGIGQDSDIIAGIVWAVDHGADVILMGFSNPDFSQNLQDAIDYAWTKGAVLVAATGNDGVSTPTFPAGDRGVIGVSATDSNDLLAAISNYGQDTFLAAPGTDIYTTGPNGGYSYITGTSASSAFVAGAAAFMKAVDSTLTNGIIVGRLARSADAIGTPGDPNNPAMFGNGRLNMASALADTGIDPVQPAGAPGGGGPYVGPYMAAANGKLSVIITGNGKVDSSPAGIDNCRSESPAANCFENYTITTPALSVTLTATPDSGYVFTGWGGDCTGTGTCSVTMSAEKSISANFSACTVPSITANPANQTKTVGESVTFSVTASGTAPLSYQWRKGGENISGATSSSYTISSVVVADTGSYDVVVSNSCGSLASNAAFLIVNKATPTITWNNPADIVYGTALGDTQLNATANVPGTFTYTPAASTVLISGNSQTLHVSFSPTDTGNYNTASKDVTINVLKKTASVTPNTANKTYGNLDPAFTGTLSGFLAADSVTATYSRIAGETVAGGPYTISATLSPVEVLGNYNITYNTASFTIAKRPATWTTNAASKIYGDADPNPLTTGSGSNFLASDNVAATYSRIAGETTNIQWGVVYPYHITATLNAAAGVLDNYIVTNAGADFTINKRPITVTAEAKIKTYGDLDPWSWIPFNITSGSLVFGDAFTGNLSRDPGERVGTYAITQGSLTLGDNYSLTFIGANLTINPAILTVTAEAKTKTYGDADPALTYNVIGYKWSDNALNSLAGYLTRDAGEDAGTYAINKGTLVTSENYILAFTSANLTINPAPLAVNADAKTKVYGNADPSLTYTAAGFKFTDTVATVLTGALARSAGEAVAGGPYAITQGTLAATSNYTIAFTGAVLTITKKDASVTASAASKTYGDTDPAFGTTNSGFLAGDLGTDKITFSVSRAGGENAGTYTITPTTSDNGTGLLGNYNISYTNGIFTINKRPVTVSADAKSKSYGDSDPILTYQITNGSLVNGDSFSGGLSRIAGETVGDYAIQQGTLALSANYELTFVGTNLTINKKAALVTPNTASKTYGDADPTLTGTLVGFLSGDNVTAAYIRTSGESAGTYTISATLSPASVLGNYDITYNTAVFTIDKKAASVTPNTASKTYGDADPTFTGTLVGFLSDDNVTAAYIRTSGEYAGTYTISATLSPAGVLVNYDISHNTATFTINKKTASVTPAAASKTYGSSDPTFSGTLTGFLTSDSVTAAYSRTAGESAGTYAISATLSPAGVLVNYDITYNTAVFTINKKTASVTPDAARKTYGDSDPTLIGTLTGFLSGDNVIATYSRTTGESAGVYSISATLAPAGVLGNYDITYNTAVFTIAARPVTVTADSKIFKILGATDPVLTYKITSGSLVNGDNFTGALSRDAGENVGGYAIRQGTLALNSNYNITFVSATFNIYFSWPGYLQPINDTAHQIGLTMSSFKAGQTIPAKFVLKNAAGAVVMQTGNPTFTRTGNLGSCGIATTAEDLQSVPADTGTEYKWDGSQYHYNWSTKGLNPGKYRIFANLEDGTHQWVDICLTK
ncbi:MBG domain-containing protein [Geomobilimonas luticola]|uniref:S8 family serine peptidase n=1 Tax=Geomobilimonas luticola TaxID=1114878 RepID=A0ABS5S8R2_9BACT|nr:MBG domain-containing protein [Geomobilimonas luticola]MBT0651768.1 S8 family serine peptidase [Geomobilimonas luticola]